MDRKLLPAFAGLMTVGLGNTAYALPISVNYNDINVATLETFESFPPLAILGTSEQFSGFTANTNAGNWMIINGGFGFCETTADQCLTNQNAVTDTRTFTAFAAGTNFLGFDLTPLTSTDIFQIEVTGESGLATFNVAGSGLLGFGDIAGLLSVSVTNLGTAETGGISNYGQDDVITGLTARGVTPVPEPSSFTLFVLGLAGLGLFGYCRRGWLHKTVRRSWKQPSERSWVAMCRQRGFG